MTPGMWQWCCCNQTVEDIGIWCLNYGVTQWASGRVSGGKIAIDRGSQGDAVKSYMESCGLTVDDVGMGFQTWFDLGTKGYRDIINWPTSNAAKPDDNKIRYYSNGSNIDYIDTALRSYKVIIVCARGQAYTPTSLGYSVYTKWDDGTTIPTLDTFALWDVERDALLRWLNGNTQRTLVLIGGDANVTGRNAVLNGLMNDMGSETFGMTARFNTDASATILDPASNRTRFTSVTDPNNPNYPYITSGISNLWTRQVVGFDSLPGSGGICKDSGNSSFWVAISDSSVNNDLIVFDGPGMFTTQYNSTYDTVPEHNVKLIQNIALGRTP